MDLLLYAACCLIWGSTWVAIKIGLEGVPPMLGAGLRFALASAVLFALVRYRRVSLRFDRDGRISVLSCGLLSFTLSYALVYRAEERISSGLTAVLFCTMPLLVALLSRFWTRAETLGPRKLAGILAGIAGTVILFRPEQAPTGAEAAGMLLALGSSAAAAVNLVMMKRHSRHVDVYALNAVGMAIGGVLLLLLSALTERGLSVAWTPANAGALVYLALFGSVAAFLAYYRLVKTMDATRLSTITLVFPLVAVALGRLCLGEPVTPRMLAGGAVVLVGVAVAALPARKA